MQQCYWSQGYENDWVLTVPEAKELWRDEIKSKSSSPKSLSLDSSPPDTLSLDTSSIGK